MAAPRVFTIYAFSLVLIFTCDSICAGGEPGETYLQRFVRQISEGSLRLVDGASSSEGRLEIYSSGIWGTICNTNWGTSEAMVACRQLGYSYVTTPLLATVTQGTGQIWLDNVDCTGQESQLQNCANRGFGIVGCGHDRDVGISCTNTSPGGSTNVAAIVVPIVVVILILVIVVVVVIVVVCVCVKKKKAPKASQAVPMETAPTTTAPQDEQTRRTSTAQEPQGDRRFSEPSAPQPPPMFNPEMNQSYNYSQQQQPSSHQPGYPQQSYPPSTYPQQAYPPQGNFPPEGDLPPPYPMYNN